jgi:hypothetical protein
MGERGDLTYQEELLIELIDHVAVIRKYLAWITFFYILGLAGVVIAWIAVVAKG